MKPRVAITYCPRCRWLLRAAWMAQELLSTFEEELGEVALRPGDSGTFQIRVETFAAELGIASDPPQDDVTQASPPRADAATAGSEILIWCRSRDGGFPEIKQLKQRARDLVAPQRDLGHSDRPQQP